MAHPDRDVLFANESFLIGVFQAVSGGSMVAGISQATAMIGLAGKIPFLVFLTFLAIGLLSAVLAAFWKHEYKKWDIKSYASAVQGKEQEATSRGDTSSRELQQMRAAFVVSLACILLAYVVLITAMWVQT